MTRGIYQDHWGKTWVETRDGFVMVDTSKKRQLIDGVMWVFDPPPPASVRGDSQEATDDGLTVSTDHSR